MAFTTLKKLSAQAAATNSGVWGAGGTTGVDLNTGVIGPLDTIVAGLSTFSVSSSDVTLTFVAGGGGSVQNCMWRFTGVLLQSILVGPAVGDATTYLNGFYFWENLTSGSFTITVQTGTGSVVLPQGRRGCLFFDGTNAPRITAMVGSGTADPIPAGSTTIWYQASAPAGWTAVALNDYAVKIVTNGSGGVTSGSVAYSTLFGRTATDGYTLAVPDIPGHQHFVANTDSVAAGVGNILSASNVMANIRSTQYQLGGTATTATVGLTNSAGGGGSHSHGLDMRVNTAAFVLASRN